MSDPEQVHVQYPADPYDRRLSMQPTSGAPTMLERVLTHATSFDAIQIGTILQENHIHNLPATHLAG